MQKLMILGAGIYQVPLIKKAQAMGLETIVVSYPGPYPGSMSRTARSCSTPPTLPACSMRHTASESTAS